MSWRQLAFIPALMRPQLFKSQCDRRVAIEVAVNGEFIMLPRCHVKLLPFVASLSLRSRYDRMCVCKVSSPTAGHMREMWQRPMLPIFRSTPLYRFALSPPPSIEERRLEEGILHYVDGLRSI